MWEILPASLWHRLRRVPLLHHGVHVPPFVCRVSLQANGKLEVKKGPRLLLVLLYASSVKSLERHTTAFLHRSGRKFNVIFKPNRMETMHTRVPQRRPNWISDYYNSFSLFLTWHRQVLQVAPPSDHGPPAAFRFYCFILRNDLLIDWVQRSIGFSKIVKDTREIKFPSLNFYAICVLRISCCFSHNFRNKIE